MVVSRMVRNSGIVLGSALLSEGFGHSIAAHVRTSQNRTGSVQNWRVIGITQSQPETDTLDAIRQKSGFESKCRIRSLGWLTEPKSDRDRPLRVTSLTALKAGAPAFLHIYSLGTGDRMRGVLLDLVALYFS
jgi:hypothetical protein